MIAPSIPKGTAKLSGLRLGFSIGALALMPWTRPGPQPGPGDVQLQITQIDRSRFPEIRVFVSATGASGEPAVVSADELRLYENGQAVAPESIVGAGEVGPLTTMLAIDISGSMAVDGKLAAAKDAALAYIDQMQAGVTRLVEQDVTLREIGTGLIDFPALVNGRQVWLCWRLGEGDIGCWHELGDGFADRSRLADLT